MVNIDIQLRRQLSLIALLISPAINAAPTTITSPPEERVFYFETGNYEVGSWHRAILEAHARYLIAHPTIRIVIQGNTDERGAAAYNLAFGQKAAESVRKQLVIMGVADSQIDAVSFGEERPANTGHNEQAWAKNRRVEIVYQD